MDEVFAYPCLTIGRVPEVLKAAARKIIEERIVMVPGDGKASTADCGSSDTTRAFQKGAAIDERLQCIHTSTERSDLKSLEAVRSTCDESRERLTRQKKSAL